jgi:hypothetical protein
MLIIGENSATVTYGSLGYVYHSVGNVGGEHGGAVQAHSNKLVWHQICNLLLAWRNGAKPHKGAQLALCLP